MPDVRQIKMVLKDQPRFQHQLLYRTDTMGSVHCQVVSRPRGELLSHRR
uniref:Uncharacterized protein n=1 Tax=Anguilla anguilla TaxID=7936 RepID=A0A0E9UG40_ANGAN